MAEYAWFEYASSKMLYVKFPVVDRIQPKLTGCDVVMENKAWKVIHNLLTALQRQLQRSDITLICENDNGSFYSSQSVTVSKLRCS